MSNQEYAASLRLIADFYEATPDMPQASRTLYVFMYQRENFINAAKTLAHGGRVEKSVDPERTSSPDYHATRNFGGVKIDVRIPRSTVCRLVRAAEYECPDSLLEEAAEYTEVKA